MGKEQILSKTGFVENHIRQLWFSHSARKIFSHDVIRDHDTGWLESKLQEQVPDGQFWFYFNTAPSTLEECERILGEMRLSGLTAVVKASFSR
jgi:hypothetical protein